MADEASGCLSCCVEADGKDCIEAIAAGAVFNPQDKQYRLNTCQTKLAASFFIINFLLTIVDGVFEGISLHETFKDASKDNQLTTQRYWPPYTTEYPTWPPYTTEYPTWSPYTTNSTTTPHSNSSTTPHSNSSVSSSTQITTTNNQSTTTLTTSSHTATTLTSSTQTSPSHTSPTQTAPTQSSKLASSTTTQSTTTASAISSTATMVVKQDRKGAIQNYRSSSNDVNYYHQSNEQGDLTGLHIWRAFYVIFCIIYLPFETLMLIYMLFGFRMLVYTYRQSARRRNAKKESAGSSEMKEEDVEGEPQPASGNGKENDDLAESEGSSMADGGATQGGATEGRVSEGEANEGVATEESIEVVVEKDKSDQQSMSDTEESENIQDKPITDDNGNVKSAGNNHSSHSAEPSVFHTHPQGHAQLNQVQLPATTQYFPQQIPYPQNHVMQQGYPVGGYMQQNSDGSVGGYHNQQPHNIYIAQQQMSTSSQPSVSGIPGAQTAVMMNSTPPPPPPQLENPEDLSLGWIDDKCACFLNHDLKEIPIELMLVFESFLVEMMSYGQLLFATSSGANRRIFVSGLNIAQTSGLLALTSVITYVLSFGHLFKARNRLKQAQGWKPVVKFAFRLVEFIFSGIAMTAAIMVVLVALGNELTMLSDSLFGTIIVWSLISHAATLLLLTEKGRVVLAYLIACICSCICSGSGNNDRRRY